MNQKINFTAAQMFWISETESFQISLLSSIINEDCYFQCGNGGCLIELAQQLAVIMIGILLTI